jgi:hypothetical protein
VIEICEDVIGSGIPRSDLRDRRTRRSVRIRTFLAKADGRRRQQKVARVLFVLLQRGRANAFQEEASKKWSAQTRQARTFPSSTTSSKKRAAPSGVKTIAVTFVMVKGRVWIVHDFSVWFAVSFEGLPENQIIKKGRRVKNSQRESVCVCACVCVGG